jgi:hypothetical protein
MSAITVRFYVSEVTQRGKGMAGNATIVMQPAYANGANKDWAVATPSGRIELQVNNPDAVALLDQWRADGVDLEGTFKPVEE